MTSFTYNYDTEVSDCCGAMVTGCDVGIACKKCWNLCEGRMPEPTLDAEAARLYYALSDGRAYFAPMVDDSGRYAVRCPCCTETFHGSGKSEDAITKSATRKAARHFETHAAVAS